MTETQLEPYQTPKHQKPPETPEERLAALEARLAQAESLASSAHDAAYPQGYGR